MNKFIQYAAFALMLFPALGSAQDLDAGVAAAEAGDYAAALREWTPLAEQGAAPAQHNLGFMYANGQGVPQDDAEAVKWYRLAAEQGYAMAQSDLGQMYRKGQGVPQDYAEAGKWYRLAAEQGYASAQFTLGRLYQIGKGVPQDFVTTHMWFNIAVANGGPGAAARDEVAARLTPADVSEAQRRAKVCTASNYQDCD